MFVKYRARFFRLADNFLQSPYVVVPLQPTSSTGMAEQRAHR